MNRRLFYILLCVTISFYNWISLLKHLILDVLPSQVQHSHNYNRSHSGNAGISLLERLYFSFTYCRQCSADYSSETKKGRPEIGTGHNRIQIQRSNKPKKNYRTGILYAPKDTKRYQIYKNTPSVSNTCPKKLEKRHL